MRFPLDRVCPYQYVIIFYRDYEMACDFARTAVRRIIYTSPVDIIIGGGGRTHDPLAGKGFIIYLFPKRLHIQTNVIN